MNTLYQLLKGMRLSVSIPAAFLVHIGYRLSDQSTDWKLVVFTGFLTGLTMLQNDYVDRDHDRKKGKYFASEHALFLFYFLIISWISLFVIAHVFFGDKAAWLTVIIGLCIGYSHFRSFVLLPLITVAVLSGSPLLLARMFESSLTSCVLFCSIAVAIMGREILKDIEDSDIDKGYKMTLLTSGIVTEEVAYGLAGTVIAAGTMLSLVIYGLFEGPLLSLYITGLSCMVVCIAILFVSQQIRHAKHFFDLGMFAILLALSL